MTHRPGRPSPRPTPRGRASLAVLLGAVVVLKLVVLLQLKDHPLVQPDAGLDTTAYADLARRVLAGDLGLGPGLYYVSPLYIYVLAAVLAVTDSFTAVRLVQIALGTAGVSFIFLMAREWFGRRAAWLAAGLATATGLVTFYEVLILQASVDTFLSAAALLALTLGLVRANPRWLLAAGALFGIASLNRPNMLLAAGGLMLACLVARRLRPAALLAAGLLAGLAPVAARNVVVAGEWSLVSSHGGLNFYIGNHAEATGFYRQVPGITPNIAGQQADVRTVAEAATGRSLTDAEASAHFSGLATQWICEHPGDAIRLLLRKLGYVLHAQHIALPYSYPFFAEDAKTLLRFLPVGPWLLVPLGLAGLLFATPRVDRRTYLLWAAFVPGYAVAVAVFFVAERYRLPLFVPLAVGAGAAIDTAIRLVAAGRMRALIPAGAFVLIGGVLVNWPLGLHDGRWEEGLRMAQRLVILGRYDEAADWTTKMEPLAPRPGSVHYGVGMQLLLANQPQRALDHLTRAHALDPAQPNAEYALGQALLELDRPAEARRHLWQGFEHGSDLPFAGYDLAVLLLDAGETEAAADVIRRIRPPASADADAWLRLGRVAMRARVHDAAESFFARAAALQPADAATRQQRGLNLLVAGRLEDAVRELGEAVRLDPNNADSLAHLAYGELQLGRIADARVHADAALAINPEDEVARHVAAAVRRIKA